MGKSVWFKWTPGVSRTGVLTQTVGSSFDTVLAIYTGSSLETLTQVGCNNNRAVDNKSRIKFNAVAGTTYYFQAGGFNGASGSLKFTVKLP
jgi:hypothetical protein